MDVGTYIKQKRGSRTITSLATAIGVSIGYLSDVEKGRRSLTIERAQQIAKELHLFGHDEEYLVGLAATSSHRLSFPTDELPECALSALWQLYQARERLAEEDWNEIGRIARTGDKNA